MTKVTFFIGAQGICGFEAKGHTGFADHGEDVVCAAVSALTQTTVIGLEEVVKIPVDLQVKNGYLKCTLTESSGESWSNAQVVLNTLYQGLQAIKAEYGNFVRIKEVQSCG